MTCSIRGETITYVRFWFGNTKERNHFRNIDVHARIIGTLKCRGNYMYRVILAIYKDCCPKQQYLLLRKSVFSVT